MKQCRKCKFRRSGGQLDSNIIGSGDWCSNSKSPRFRTRFMPKNSCSQFRKIGKKAPLALKLANKGLKKMTKQ